MPRVLFVVPELAGSGHKPERRIAASRRRVIMRIATGGVGRSSRSRPTRFSTQDRHHDPSSPCRRSISRCAGSNRERSEGLDARILFPLCHTESRSTPAARLSLARKHPVGLVRRNCLPRGHSGFFCRSATVSRAVVFIRQRRDSSNVGQVAPFSIGRHWRYTPSGSACKWVTERRGNRQIPTIDGRDPRHQSN